MPLSSIILRAHESEAGIANALGKDLFVLCESRICSDGIFDRSWNTYMVVELSTLDENSPELSEFFAHIADWAAQRPPAQAP